MNRWKQLFFASACTAAILCTSSNAAAEGFWDFTSSWTADGNICMDFPEFDITIPSSWNGRFRVGTTEDCITFYNTKSRDLYTSELGYANGGTLFTIGRSTDFSFYNLPSFEVLAEEPDFAYYAAYVTDYQAYYKDTSAKDDYDSMYRDISWIISTVRMKNGIGGEVMQSPLVEIPATGNSDYLLPESSSGKLTADDIAGMDENELQMAINEIYARHHRKFILPEVQAYFNAKSWYEGSIEAADFDTSVISSLEWDNINFLLKAMRSRTSVSPASGTLDVYGTVITCGSGFFKLQQADGSITQFWYDSSRLGNTAGYIRSGITASVIYDTESYEALSVTLW
mgnify:CR=1 FL=1